KFDGYAWDIIKDEAIKANGELELITLGPLTNIAITFMRYPEIKPLIKRIICMGGSAYEGNITPKAEFNVWVDPDAFNYVFHSGVPIVMCGLDSTEQAYLTIDELKAFVGRDTKIKDLFDHIFNFFINKRTNSTDDDKLQTIYDAITVAWALDESIGTTKKYYVTVETKGPNAGWTILDRRGKYKKEPNVEVLETADREKFKAMLEEMLDYYKN
ncbi:MAG: nucleoside hydrolase, partial [Oscillospiraceae bacterium]|nr:nucleoside hydrolase [Oscillospiraceae bacterium]